MTEKTKCPLCGAAGLIWLSKNGFELLQCSKCDHRYCLPSNPESHVREIYDDQYFKDSAEGYVDYLGEEAIQSASARYYVRRLKSLLPAESTVLDLGAACGFFLNEFRKAGWHAFGIEPNAAMRAFGKERFGLDIRDQSLAQATNNQSLELISAIQVISHLINPLEFVEQSFDKLKPGGFLLIETWDRNSLAAKLSGSNWHELNPPSVLHWFSRASLRKLVGSNGFEFVESGMPRKSIQLGRAVRMLRHSWSDWTVAKWLSSPLMLVPERLLVPYRLGDAFWMLFKKCC